MDRIKDLKEVILRGDMILAEVVAKKEKSHIIMPESMGVKASLDYLKVLAVGYSVTDLTVGDVLLEVTGNIEVYELANGTKVTRIPRMNVMVAVKESNFDENVLPVEEPIVKPVGLIN